MAMTPVTSAEQAHEDVEMDWTVDPRWPPAVLEEARAKYRLALEDDVVCSNLLTNGFATMGGGMPKLAAHLRRVSFDRDTAELRALWERYRGEPEHVGWVEVVGRALAQEAAWEGAVPRRPDFVAIVRRWVGVDEDVARHLVRFANEFDHGGRLQIFWIELVNCRALGVRQELAEAGL